MVGSGRNRFEGGKGKGGGGPSDGFIVEIGSRIGNGGRSGAGGGRGREKHIQWGERIKWIGIERSECRPLGMKGHTSGLLRQFMTWLNNKLRPESSDRIASVMVWNNTTQ